LLFSGSQKHPKATQEFAEPAAINECGGRADTRGVSRQRVSRGFAYLHSARSETPAHYNFDVQVASINSSYQPLGELAADDREESAKTFYIKRAGAAGAARAHLRTLVQRPAAYIRGLIFALSLGGTDLRQLLYSIFYFTEALMLGNWMEREGLDHVHVHFVNRLPQ